MKAFTKNRGILTALLILSSLALLSCNRSRPAPDDVDIEPTAVIAENTVVVTRVVEKLVEVTPQPFTVAHPLLGDARIRQAIAHCIDREALIAALYPYLDTDARASLFVDSFLPNEHWAYAGPYPDHAYDPAAGSGLLESAGWSLAEDAIYRTNAAGDVLTLKLTTTDSQTRQTWAEVVEDNLRDCGVQLVRLHTPASWWLGADTGLQRRDFELGAYAQSSQAEPDEWARYTCGAIPLPANDWEGENYSGWCNAEADTAVRAVESTLDQVERKRLYGIVQEKFIEDMPALPLYRRAEAEAWTNNIAGITPNPSEFSTAHIGEWQIAEGDTIRIGMLDEPAQIMPFGLQTPSLQQIAQIGLGSLWTADDYGYQPRTQTPLPTLENGLISVQMIDVKAGDRVVDVRGEAQTLGPGLEVVVDGDVVTYDGNGSISLPRMTVEYRFDEFTWSDGVAATTADIELAHRFACRPESAQPVCAAIADVAFGPGMQATVTYLPGYFNPTATLSPWPQLYPSHLALADGRLLSDAPPDEWQSLAEFTNRPLSYGPYRLAEWTRGERMVFEANPHYAPAPQTPRVVIEFVPNPEEAVARLQNGELDYLERALVGEHEMQMLTADARAGINLAVIPGPIRERLDMNLFVP
ncbi:MAG: peptide ABC transporter substrate-binding protein [Caldilineales bacterium]|nr:peptide ABC transporter substrate-binding protein [Caldilineales bacterium]